MTHEQLRKDPLHESSRSSEYLRALDALQNNPLCFFRDWPNREVPEVAAGTYTVWHGDDLLYVGMAGRGLSMELIAIHRGALARGKGLSSRLNSHASGRRSGDQFCVYISDRIVLPTLSPESIARIAAGHLSLDGLVRAFVHEHLSYRWAEVVDGRTASKIERAIRGGALNSGAPLLNPAPDRG
jgi:hypothetical protein